MKFNPIAKLILKGAEAAATALIPGAAAVDTAAHAVFDHDPKAVTKVLDGIEGALTAAEFVHGDEIADQALFKAGCALAVQGHEMIVASLKHAPK